MIHRQPSVPSTDPTVSARDNASASERGKKRRQRSGRSRPQGRRLLLEGLEQRQLMAANPISPVTTLGGDNTGLSPFSGPRNVGTVPAFQATERERPGVSGENDFFQNAEFLNLGNLAGQRNTIDLRGTNGFVPRTDGGFTTDIDTFAFDLKAGDILDIAAIGSTTQFTTLLPNGQIWFGVDPQIDGTNESITYPFESPLQTFGNQAFAQVVPADGRYYVTVSANDATSNYTLGLRTYRAVTEQYLPIGQSQIVYLDFDGGVFPRDLLNQLYTNTGVPVGGVARIPTMQSSLVDLGILGVTDASYQAMTRKIIDEFTAIYNDLGTQGFNGNFAANGRPGSYQLTILNSFDHPDPGNGLNVSRILIGGTEADYGFSALIAESVDVGNFLLQEYAVVQIDAIIGVSQQFPRSNSISDLDAIGIVAARVAAHEASHIFGMRHTDGNNLVPTISDEGGFQRSFDAIQGVGFDGIVGTEDDIDVFFRTDRFSQQEGIFGTNFIGQSLAFTLTSGTLGGGFGGRVANDLNGDGNIAGDPGLPGATVFLDINRNGLLDPSEPQAITGADGIFTLAAASGTYNVIAIPPANFRPTTGTAVAATTGSTTASFGFTQLITTSTGFKFEDLNANGFRDPGEPGIAGAYIYADIDGDDQPDVQEPSAITAADGSYTLNLPILGRQYAIREVAEPGFERTTPSSGEWLINYTGGPLPQSYDFGGRAARDYGDAPDSYLTSRAAGGPSHGLREGLRIGNLVDRENDALVSATASGDDLDGVADDEDGVVVSTPITSAAGGSFQISLTNTTGQSGYLSAWIDLNGDGNFNGPGEKFVSDRVLGTGLHTLTVPAGGTVGDTFARFRYSLTAGVSSAGAATAGEVEDHQVRILTNAALANDDTVSVPRNSVAFPIDVLANDFNTPTSPLTIVSDTLTANNGVVTITTDPVGSQRLLYTPRNSYVGPDRITYSVRNPAGTTATATVFVNVTFQTGAPIAIDDLFEVPSTSTSVPLNILRNDIPSVAGGLTLVSVMPGSAGGTLNIVEGGQSVTYSPPTNGFRDSEQFRYTVQDDVGATSVATVTVVLTPDALNNDLASYTLRILDSVNGTPRTTVDPVTGQSRTTIQQGEEFLLEVLVDDLRNIAVDDAQGIASAFLDVIYSSELVSPVDNTPGNNSPFEIVFGPRFQSNTFPTDYYRNGDPSPGLLNEIGSTVPIAILETAGDDPDLASHTGPTRLFTILMRATGSGVAIFQADPADATESETLLIDVGNVNQTAVPFNLQRFGSLEMTIAPSGTGFPSAVDDALMNGRDSLNRPISSAGPARLDVLANDLVGTGGTIIGFDIVTAPGNGRAVVNRGGAGFADDFIEYTRNIGTTTNPESGLDSFTYFVTVNSPQFGIVTSIATVDVVTGTITNPLVRFEAQLVDANLDPITSVRVGDRFGVQISALDLRERDDFEPGDVEQFKTTFAAFMDVLYDRNLLQPTDLITADDFDFDVVFDAQFNEEAAVGVGARAGIIDEFGSILQSELSSDLGSNVLATIFFRAVGAGTARVATSPADRFPEQDTLRVNQNQPVPVSQIDYRSIDIPISGAIGGEPLHNFSLPADVNGDNVVSAIDALLIINMLGKTSPSGEPIRNGFEPVYFHDVDGNGRVSAVDALRVINYLNGIRPAGESVAPAVVPPASETSLVDEAIVSAAADGVDDSAASKATADASIVSGSATLPSVRSSESTTTDEDDDVLGLLADDVAGIWG